MPYFDMILVACAGITYSLLCFKLLVNEIAIMSSLVWVYSNMTCL